MAIKRGQDPKYQFWQVSTLPKYVAKKGPLDFLYKL
jgi:hypothetical protein